MWLVGQQGHMLHRPTTPPSGPILTASTDLLDFGTVNLGGVRRGTMTLHNRGTDTLEISSITASSDLSVDQSALSLAPGASRLIQVVYTPTFPIDSDPGQPNGIVTVTTNDSVGTHFQGVRRRAADTGWVRTTGVTEEDLLGIAFPTDTIGYAFSMNKIYRTDDGAASWTELPFTPPGPIRGMDFEPDGFELATTGWVVGGEGGSVTVGCDANCQSFIYRTTNSGQNWTLQSTGVSNAVQDIYSRFPNTSVGYAVTSSYTSGNTNFRSAHDCALVFVDEEHDDLSAHLAKLPMDLSTPFEAQLTLQGMLHDLTKDDQAWLDTSLVAVYNDIMTDASLESVETVMDLDMSPAVDIDCRL